MRIFSRDTNDYIPTLQFDSEGNFIVECQYCSGSMERSSENPLVEVDEEFIMGCSSCGDEQKMYMIHKVGFGFLIKTSKLYLYRVVSENEKICVAIKKGITYKSIIK